MRSAPNRCACRLRPDPPLAVARDGHGLRDRQPEGRRGQDDHRGQRRRLHRRGRLPDAARRHRPAGQRDRRARPARRTREPSVYDVLRGDGDAPTRRCADRRSTACAAAVAPRTSPARTSSCRAQPGSETRLREALAPLRERFAYIAARLPAVARAADGQRAGRGRPRDRPGADRVLRARGPRRPARHARPRPARAQPAPDGRGHAADDARRPHAPGARRRARGARALPGARLRHRHPAQRAHRRGAELRPPGHPPRPALRRVRTPTSSSPRRSPPVADARAWAAASPRSCSRLRAGEDGDGAELRELAGRADRARTRASRASASTRRRCRRSPTRCRSAASCSRSSCARVAGGTLRAGRRRAPLARGAARRPRARPGARARSATTPRRSRSR